MFTVVGAVFVFLFFVVKGFMFTHHSTIFGASFRFRFFFDESQVGDIHNCKKIA